MGIHAGSRVADNELFLFSFDCSICSELYCRCLKNMPRCAVWVHRRQCWLMYLLQLLPGLTQCLERVTKHNGNNIAAQLRFVWVKTGAWAKNDQYFPVRTKLWKNTELRWFRILTTHCNSFQASGSTTFYFSLCVLEGLHLFLLLHNRSSPGVLI